MDGEGSKQSSSSDSATKSPRRSLGDQLWADIAKARAEQEAPSTGIGSSTSTPIPVPSSTATTPPSSHPGEDTLLHAIQNVLSLDRAASSPSSTSPLDSTIVPESNGQTLRATLEECFSRGAVDPNLASTLVPLVHVALNKLGSSKKRKRPKTIDAAKPRFPPRATHPSLEACAAGPSVNPYPNAWPPPSPSYLVPPPPPPPNSLVEYVFHAINIVHSFLSQNPHPLTRDDLLSIQGPLHQIFLFCATSAVGPNTEDPGILQEITGLIHILGILHQVTIAPPSTVLPLARTHQTIYNSGTPLPTRHLRTVQSSFMDIGTAVYPCLYPSCGKTFSKLYHLRKHEAAHSFDRPFKCNLCPAAFARKHDLQRHDKSHSSIVYKCGGCRRTFTRRDALRRHMVNVKAKDVCRNGTMEEVEADASDVHATSRRVRVMPPPQVPGSVGGLEEGELSRDAVAQAQGSVRVLLPFLQRHVAERLAPSPPGAAPPPSTTSGSGTTTSLFLPGFALSEEQTGLLEKAIAEASEAARAQAELEAQMELGQVIGENDPDELDDEEMMSPG
ncbi:Metallothionein expression activator [Tulasnella sp. JGI-2019a]|nr:Metallothionein expression activator [Tulasnella sp. JGI-2019a]KAG9028393.1 Metallothionein expression activator [Tulasnella sp. JGI-2019a]